MAGRSAEPTAAGLPAAQSRIVAIPSAQEQSSINTLVPGYRQFIESNLRSKPAIVQPYQQSRLNDSADRGGYLWRFHAVLLLHWEAGLLQRGVGRPRQVQLCLAQLLHDWLPPLHTFRHVQTPQHLSHRAVQLVCALQLRTHVRQPPVLHFLPQVTSTRQACPLVLFSGWIGTPLRRLSLDQGSVL